MTVFFEPDELVLAARLAEWLSKQETKFVYDIEATFHFDGEATGIAVRRDGGGEYSVAVER